MNDSFLCPDKVLKISVASYMWFLSKILASQPPDLNLVTHFLTLKATSGALRINANHCPDSRKRRVRKACAIISGNTNFDISYRQG